MIERMNVETALRPSTRNSRAIIAPKVFSVVGAGTGALVIRAAIASALGASAVTGAPGAAPFLPRLPRPRGGWNVVAIAKAYSRYSRPVRVRKTVSRLGLS